MQAENVHRPYRHTTIKLYSHEISRLHHSLDWNILVTLVYSTLDSCAASDGSVRQFAVPIEPSSTSAAVTLRERTSTCGV